MSKSNKELSALGYKSKVPEFPDKNILEKVTNPKVDVNYAIRFTCPEFTSICPVTSQPDFAHIIIDYVPNKYIVESKSFKLYLYCNIFFQGSTDIGDFHMYYKINGSDTQQVVYANAGYGNSLRWGTYQNNQIINLDTAGDYVELYAYADMTSGGTMNLNHNSTSIQRTNWGGYKIA